MCTVKDRMQVRALRPTRTCITIVLRNQWHNKTHPGDVSLFLPLVKGTIGSCRTCHLVDRGMPDTHDTWKGLIPTDFLSISALIACHFLFHALFLLETREWTPKEWAPLWSVHIHTQAWRGFSLPKYHMTKQSHTFYGLSLKLWVPGNGKHPMCVVTVR